MKVIILNGLIASGKTTLGKLLVDHFNSQGSKAVFYDLDDLVEKRSPNFKWKSRRSNHKDWLESRKELAELANKSLKQENIVIAVGPFFQRDEIAGFTRYLDPDTQVFLYTLVIPLPERLRRNRLRKPPNPEEDLKVQQNLFGSLTEHYGYDIEGSGSEKDSLEKITVAINDNLGEVKTSDFA